MTQHNFESFLLLAILSVTYSTALVRIERLRLAVTAGQIPNVLNVWVFAGVLVLPWPLLVVLVLASYAGEWPARRIVGTNPGRYVYSACAFAASAIAAHLVVQATGSVQGVILAAAVFTTVNVALIAVVMVIARHFRAMRMFCSVRAHLTEAATILLGCALAGAMAWHTTVALSALPALAVLHRDSLREVIRTTRSFDERTGLWTELAWKVQGRQMLADAVGHVALMIIDPDGPDMETAIAANLGNGLRHGDLIGHYGTRQVVLIVDVGPACVGRRLATGMRGHLADAGIPLTLGYATADSGDLDDLLITAMCDLMTRRALGGVDHRW